jgi:hypothetical protein
VNTHRPLRHQTSGKCGHEVVAGASPALALRDATGTLDVYTRPADSMICGLGLDSREDYLQGKVELED